MAARKRFPRCAKACRAPHSRYMPIACPVESRAGLSPGAEYNWRSVSPSAKRGGPDFDPTPPVIRPLVCVNISRMVSSRSAGHQVKVFRVANRYRYFGFLELGNELRYRIVQAQLSFFEHHHHGDAGNGLGHGRQAEDRVLLHGAFRFDIHQAVRFEVHDAAAPGHQRYGARNFTGVDMALDGLVNSPQTLDDMPASSGLPVGTVPARKGARISRANSK